MYPQTSWTRRTSMRLSTVVAILVCMAVGVSLCAEMTVTECVKIALNQKVFKTRTCTVASARADSPGWRGGTKHAENTSCIEAASDYAIIGAPSVRRLSCNDNRCDSNLSLMRNESGKTAKACITAKAWSESESFGAGGWSSYEMCADVEESIPADDILEIMKGCDEQIHGQVDDQ